MRAGLAFYRLLCRPFTLWAAWLLLIGPVAVLDATDGQLSAASRMMSEGRAVAGFGMLAMGLLALPAGAGFGAGAVNFELQSCSFAWMLPGVRRRLLVSVVPFALLVSLPGAVLAPSFPAGVAVLVLGLVTFGLGLALFDRVTISWAVGAAPLLLIGGAVSASRILAFVANQPAGAVAVGLPVAAALFYRASSLDVARARARGAGRVAAPAFIGLSGPDESWLLTRLRAWSAEGNGPLLGPWLGAVLFEKQRRWFGPGRREVGLLVLQYLMFVGLAVVAGSSVNYMLLVTALAVGLKASVEAPYLEPVLLQPLARRRRALIEYTASLLDALLLLVALGLVFAAGAWTLGRFRPDLVYGAGEIVRVLAAAGIAVPLVQHLRLGDALADRRVLMRRGMTRFYVWTLIFVLVLTAAWSGLGRVVALAGGAGSGRVLQVAFAFVLLALSQAVYAGWLFRLHRRGDLI